MTSDRWARIQEMFRRALERSFADRGSFLREACGADVELFDTVSSLLAAHDAGGMVGDVDRSAAERDLAALEAAVGERYRVEEALGSGGMANVYRATDSRHDRPVAIKVLRRDVSSGLGTDRFLREIRIAAGLRHPNILPVYDSGRAGELLYYVMPVESESLRDRLRRDTALPFDTALQITAEVADALDFAHAQGVVHRDVKPENILLSHGHAVISDFGIARAIHAAGGTTITHAGLPIGSPAYMSPEQIEAEIDVDGRSDIYSLALVLYEMLSGTCAFTGPNPHALLARRARSPSPELALPPAVAPDVEAALRAALNTNRDNRPATAGEFLGMLSPGGVPLARVTTPAPANVPRHQSIAVLPFENLSPDTQDDYLGNGLAEELINALTQLDGLRVAARTSSFALKGTTLDVADIGAKLRVDTILEGSVRRADAHVRITAQLINVADGYHIWSERYDRDIGDVFAIQDEIASAIVGRLKLSLATSADVRAAPPTTDVEAYHLYLKGRHLWNERSKESLERAVRFYEDAIARDERFALAYSGLADTYLLLQAYNFAPPEEAIANAKSAVERALELDKSLAEAHTSRGQVYRLERDWLGEERSYRQAIELNPRYPTAHQWYATHLAARGKFDQALREIRLAEELDPLSHAISVTGAVVLYLARRTDESIEQLHRTLALEPNFASPHAWLGSIYAGLGRHDEARREARRAAELAPHNPNVLTGLAFSYATSGDRGKAMEMIEAAERRGAHAWCGVLYTALGELDRAFDCLERGADEPHSWDVIYYLKVFPWLDPLRDHPRYAGLVRRMNIPD